MFPRSHQLKKSIMARAERMKANAAGWVGLAKLGNELGKEVPGDAAEIEPSLSGLRKSESGCRMHQFAISQAAGRRAGEDGPINSSAMPLS
jgi:hypothetical protein